MIKLFETNDAKYDERMQRRIRRRRKCGRDRPFDAFLKREREFRERSKCSLNVGKHSERKDTDKI